MTLSSSVQPTAAAEPVRCSAASARPSLAVVVLTLNEAVRIQACLGRVPDSIPSFVLDSGSTDATVEIARAAGAGILTNPWPGFAAQRNFALERLQRFDWILFIDADEIFPISLFNWVLDYICGNPQSDVVQIPSKLWLCGRVLRHAPTYPVYHPRLVRTARARFTVSGTGHGETVAEGLRIEHADLEYIHDIVADGFAAWAAKHVRLATMEGQAARRAELAGGVVTLRRRLGRMAPKGPVRAALRFAFHYIVCLGFLDGAAGFRYALMYAWYELTKWLVAADLKKNPSRG